MAPKEKLFIKLLKYLVKPERDEFIAIIYAAGQAGGMTPELQQRIEAWALIVEKRLEKDSPRQLERIRMIYNQLLKADQSAKPAPGNRRERK